MAAVEGAAGAPRMAAGCALLKQGQRHLVWSNAWFITKVGSTKGNDKNFLYVTLKCLPILYQITDRFGQEAKFRNCN